MTQERYEEQRKTAAKQRRVELLYTAYRKAHGDVCYWSKEVAAQYDAEAKKLKDMELA